MAKVYSENASSSLQLKWELGSPVLGMLLRKYAPSDTYEVCALVHTHQCNTKMCFVRDIILLYNAITLATIKHSAKLSFVCS